MSTQHGAVVAVTLRPSLRHGGDPRGEGPELLPVFVDFQNLLQQLGKVFYVQFAPFFYKRMDHEPLIYNHKPFL